MTGTSQMRCVAGAVESLRAEQKKSATSQRGIVKAVEKFSTETENDHITYKLDWQSCVRVSELELSLVRPVVMFKLLDYG
ncbi:hypothetical protein NDU88_000755 [Pleurodeles waltl]|uniref:Uncharacterized protein n=1 Tax=Pleurodeles waltl TaxID=8319 RepID=A0AAV7SY73_PLEWA|nr:hypothetical protein NDU88_000755 [Pleurodeles waltl]